MTLKGWNICEYSALQGADFDILFEISRHVGIKDAIFQVHGSFGDVYMQLSVLSELIDRGASFAILIDDKYKRLAMTALGDRAQILFVNQPHLNAILNRQRVLGFSKNLPIRLLPTLYPMVAELIVSGLLKYSDFLRFLIHREVKQTGPFREIEGDDERIEAREHISKLGLCPGKTLLVSPVNNTQLPIPNRVLLHAVSIARDCGWDICINTAASRSDLRVLAAEAPEVVFFDVPAHLPVSFATACGFYVVGNNGFATIQALFNSECEGLHLINGFDAVDGLIKDQAGNRVEVSRFPHAVMFRDQFLGVQIEHVLQNPDSFDCGEPILRAGFMR